MWKKSSPLPGFEPVTFQVTVHEANDIPICHCAFVPNLTFIIVESAPRPQGLKVGKVISPLQVIV